MFNLNQSEAIRNACLLKSNATFQLRTRTVPHTCTRTRTHARTRTHMNKHARTHAHAHTCTHTQALTHTHTHARTHARTIQLRDGKEIQWTETAYDKNNLSALIIFSKIQLKFEHSFGNAFLQKFTSAKIISVQIYKSSSLFPIHQSKVLFNIKCSLFEQKNSCQFKTKTIE